MINKDTNPHHILFAVGMLAMVLSFAMFAFVLYILPHIFFHWHYDVPEFVIQLETWYQTQQSLQGFMLVIAIFTPFILAGLVFAYIAKKANLIIERDHELDAHHELEPEFRNQRFERDQSESLTMGLKLLAIIAIVLLALFLVEYLINVDMITHQTER